MRLKLIFFLFSIHRTCITSATQCRWLASIWGDRIQMAIKRKKWVRNASQIVRYKSRNKDNKEHCAKTLKRRNSAAFLGTNISPNASNNERYILHSSQFSKWGIICLYNHDSFQLYQYDIFWLWTYSWSIYPVNIFSFALLTNIFLKTLFPLHSITSKLTRENFQIFWNY